MARQPGSVDPLPSGKWRARYSWQYKRYTKTFTHKTDAWAWIRSQIVLHETGKYEDFRSEKKKKKAGDEKFQSFALRWIDERTNSRGKKLAIRTRTEYKRMITTGRLTPFANVPLNQITPDMVRAWWSDETRDEKLTATSHAYSLLKSILSTAEEDELITRDPCTIRGASSARTGNARRMATSEEISALITAATGSKYQNVVRLAAYGGFRISEILSLEKADITPIYENDTKTPAGLEISVTKHAVHDKENGKWVVVPGAKSEAGVRDVAIYGQDVVIPIWEWVKDRPDGYLWPGKNGSVVSYFTFRTTWQRWKKKANVDGIDFHSLRHYHGTRFAQKTDASLKETMARLGHSTPEASIRYQHSGDRDHELAKKAAR